MAQGDYGKVQHGFWTDPDIKRVLSPEQKCLLLYYFSSPHANMIGLYHCPLEYAAGETGLPIAQVRVWTFGALAKFVSYDERTEEVLVHRGAEHNLGVAHLEASDNRAKAVRRLLIDVHSERLRVLFHHLHADWPLGPTPPSPNGHSPKPLIEPLTKDLPSPSEAISVSVSVSEHSITDSVSYETGASADDFELPPPDEPLTVCAQFMPLLRELGYEADRSDGSILTALDKKNSRDEIEAAIRGLALMRNAGQLKASLGVDRDSPLSMKILYDHSKTKHQAQHWWHQAQQAFYKNQRVNQTGLTRAAI